MSTYTHFAIVGGSVIGNTLATILASVKDTSVLCLTRVGSESKAPKIEGISHAEIDYTNPAQIAETLKAHKIEVVLSTVGSAGVESQKIMADASKAAGVKIFVLSEYGVTTTKMDDGYQARKTLVAQHLVSIGLPSIRVFCGLFEEYITWLVGYSVNKKFNVVHGAGDTKVSLTSIGDVAGFVAHILTTLPPVKLENQIFRIQGEYCTFNEIAAALNVEVVNVDAVPAEEGKVADYQTMLQNMVVSGNNATVLSDLEEGDPKKVLSNGLWEGHVWKSAKEVAVAQL